VGFVLDASAALSFVLPGEIPPPAVSERLQAGEAVTVPGVFPHETVNAILVAHRRKRFNAAEVQRALAFIEQLEVEVVAPRSLVEIYGLAARWSLSAYDASYLAVAIARGIDLATLDERLAAAARSAGVNLV
jgi:predicted nucleic acid-binding protein